MPVVERVSIGGSQRRRARSLGLAVTAAALLAVSSCSESSGCATEFVAWPAEEIGQPSPQEALDAYVHSPRNASAPVEGWTHFATAQSSEFRNGDDWSIELDQTEQGRWTVSKVMEGSACRDE